MRKTKILVVTLLAGFILHQLALCQTGAADSRPTAAGPATSNDVYGSMVSNVIKLSTTGNPPANAPAGAPPKMAEGSNQPISFTTSNESAAGETSANAVAGAPPKVAEGSNQPVSFTTSNESTAAATGGAVAGGSNTPAALAGGNEPVSGVSMSNDLTTAGGTNQPVSMTATNETSEAGSTNSAAPAAAELPIQFQDVPITTAIESLARLAGINYLLDPKIAYGQPDEKGLIKPEPTLTIRWENVTAEQALVALLDNYGLQLVQNPKTRIYKITTKDTSAPPPLITRVVQLKYASTSNMVVAVLSTLTDKRDKVVPDPRSSQMVVVATESEQSDVDSLISQLDKPERQVLIETKLVELSSNPSTSKGVDWSGTLQAQNVTFGNGVLTGTSTTTSPGTPQTITPAGTTPTVTTAAVTSPSGAVISPATTTGGTAIPAVTSIPGSSTVNSLISTIGSGGVAASTAGGFLPNTGFLTADGLKAVLSFINQSSEAQVVSTPRVVTLDNETATIAVTRSFPVINVTAGTANSTGGSQITYSNIGTILEVTPRITANDFIWLRVVPDVSSFFATVTKSIGGAIYQADEFDSRHIDTKVLIPNSHTLVMGGLVKDNPNASYTKVPVLGDIPVLGLAFRYENKSMEKDNLLIFITPTIVKDTDFKPATTDFLDSSPRTMKDPMNMHTWLDSAQPRGDWSNPLDEKTSEAP
jgi:type II secretory pathway component GspD/PulD (secretin)